MRLRTSLNLAHPPFIYAVVWLLVLFLTNLRLTTQLPVLNANTVILVGGNIVSFWLLYFFVGAAFRRRTVWLLKDIPILVLNKLNRFVRWILAIWLLGTLIEIIYARGVPLLWALNQGLDKNYTNFGIPTFHGLMNALYLLSITALFLDYLACKKRKTLGVLLFLLMWPVLTLGRSVLLGALCQMSAVFFIFHRISIKRLLSLSVLVLLVVWAFGALGDIRGTPNPFVYLVDSQYQETFQKLPSGFLWFYVYVTSPLSNIIANVDQVVPTYIPYYSIAGLFPTVIRDLIFPATLVYHNSFTLVDSGLNVSTFYAGFLSDFGVAGSLIVVVILQLLCVIVYFYAKRKHVWAVLAYAVLFQCIVFSVFYNLFFLQVYIMQILIAWYAIRRVERSALRNTDHGSRAARQSDMEIMPPVNSKSVQ